MIGKALTTIGLVAIAVTAYFTSPLWTKRPFKEVYNETQVECLAAIGLADTAGEAPEYRQKAQELVVDTAIRLREAVSPKGEDGKPTLSYCVILEKVLTVYPLGWQHPLTFTGRNLVAIKKPFVNKLATTWTEAMNVATKGLEKGADPKRKATHYVRAKAKYTFFTSEREAQEVIRAGKHEPGPAGLLIEFYWKQNQ